MNTRRLVLKSFLLSLLFVLGTAVFAQAAKREFYEIKIYTISNPAQEQGLDAYLKDAYMPAMHRQALKLSGFSNRDQQQTTPAKKCMFSRH